MNRRPAGQTSGYERSGRRWSLPALFAVVLAAVVWLVGGCASSNVMNAYVPKRCNSASTPFRTFDLLQADMPGFIEPVVGAALEAALIHAGLEPAPAGTVADVTLLAQFSMLDPEPESAEDPAPPDPFGDHVETGELTRFVAHVDLALRDNRDGVVVWRGSMERAHAIVGGETFHDERAVLVVATTLERMFRGLMDPCGT